MIFSKAKLQGPAPNPETPKVVVHFVTTHFSNYDAHKHYRGNEKSIEKLHQ